MAKPKTFISWNVNGLRAVLKKGFAEWLLSEDPDVVCLQEIKAEEHQVDYEFPGYHQYWYSAEKKGYSGTLVLSKVKPLSVSYGLGDEEHDKEGRVITVEYASYFLVNVYTPNSKNELQRLDYRTQVWDRLFLEHLVDLEKSKPVITCGDFNVAHKEIDLRNPKTNKRNAGFTIEERTAFDAYIQAGFIDTFREFNQEPDQHTWWSYRMGARERNVGWRIDYFLISPSLRKQLKHAFILQEVMGSDHCPVGITIG
jgi:exodeoxyribonuclease-3